jgi:hypothetical protein
MTYPRLPRLRVRLRFAVAAACLLASSAAAESEFERTAPLLALEPGMTVAEIGAGEGDFTLDNLMFGRRSEQIAILDWSMPALIAAAPLPAPLCPCCRKPMALFALLPRAPP